MHFDLLVKGGRIVSPEGMQQADIGIVGETIREIGDLAQADAADVLDVRGLTIFPGLIDSHTHLREPGAPQKEDFESGTRAAVAGGVTTVFDMPNTTPTTTDEAALLDKVARLKDRVWCDVGFWVGATAENIEQLPELEKNPHVAGIKMFMGSSTGSLLIEDEETQRRVLQSGRLPVAVHAEDEARLRNRKSLMSPHPSVKEHSFIRDEGCAQIAVERIVQLSLETWRRVHILHVSSDEEIPQIERAKANGYPVTAEVTPHHLYLAAPDAYQKHGSLVQVNPPIRTSWHQQSLRRALAEGAFDTIGSDHAPHTYAEKMRPYPGSPSGIVGIQTTLPLLVTLAVRDEVFPIESIAAWMGRNPAQMFGLSKKGTIAPGYDADLAIVDINLNRQLTANWLRSKCTWSPYVGERLFGWPMHTVVRGRVALRDEELVGPPNGRAAEFDRVEAATT